MRADDFDDVTALWRHSSGVGVRPDETREWFLRYLARNPGLSWTARIESSLAGAVLCGHDGRRGYLYHLAVAEGARRRGIGRALVRAAIASLADEGISRATIFVYADNDSAQDFWRSLGWGSRLDLAVLQYDLLPPT
jgi:ribosomal protein S18 acetylase RimI-like enzyme